MKRLLLLLSLHLLMQNAFPQTNVSGDNIRIDNISEKKCYGFVENKGQVHDQHYQPNNSVKYLFNSNGLNVQLKANSFSYDTYVAMDTDYKGAFSNPGHKNKSISNGFIDTNIKKNISFKFHRIDIILEGANLNPVIIPENPSPNVLNFYTLSGNTKGCLNVHHYKKITYSDIYPKIDLVFDLSRQKAGNQVEYYFILRPGADPHLLRLHYAGAINTKLITNTIEIAVAPGKLIEQIPASYILPDSTVAYNKANKKIDVRYRSYGNNTFGFSIPAYNKSQTLIIDPTPDLEWGTFYGQSLNDWGYAIAKDNIGNLFIGGSTNNAVGIATSGSFQSTFGGGYSDAILAKFNSNGALQWLTFFGGSSQDEAFGVATDGNNVILTGWTFSSTSIATPGSFQQQKAGPIESADAFIAKFDNNGIRQWSTYFGGNDEDFSAAAATDANGNIFIVGYTVSQTDIATPGAFQQSYAGGNPAYGESGDGYIAKFSSAGVIQWSTYYGGGRGDRCHGIAIDTNGDVLVAGSSNSSDHISSTVSYQGSLSGTNDAFIVKLSNDGSRLWGTYYGGTNGEDGFAVATDNNNNVFITGWTYSTNGIATPGTQQQLFGGNYTDAFIAKFNANGERQWGTYYGGNGAEIGNAIATDQSGNVFITGWSFSTNNIVTLNTYQSTGGSNVLEWTPYVSKFNANGLLQWGTYYGSGASADPNIDYSNGEGEGIVTDANGNVYICGATSFRNGISTCDAQQPVNGGFRDIFIAKFTPNIFSSQPSVSITADTTGSFCQGLAVTFKATTYNTGSNIIYQWKLNGINVGANSDTYINNTLVNDDIINCVISLPQTPCNTSGSITSNKIVVSVSALVSPSVTISSSANSICTGNTVAFRATAVNSGTNPAYQWKINGINTGTNSSTYSNSALSNGDVISCIVTSSSNCTATPTVTSNLIQVTVKELILQTMLLKVSPDNICNGMPVTIQAVSGNIAGTPVYQWKLNGLNTGNNNSGYTSNNFSDNDLVNCIVTTEVPGCTDPVKIYSDTVMLKINNGPVVILNPSDTAILPGASLQLNALIVGNVDYFEWNPKTGLSNPQELNPLATPGVTTTYQLKVVDRNGCETTEKISISIRNDIFIPNAFSPNNDGKNDFFGIPPGSAFTLSLLSVYDRWGNEIFKTADANKKWDGRNKGIMSPVGSYVYIIKGRTSKGAILLKGTVLLVR